MKTSSPSGPSQSTTPAAPPPPLCAVCSAAPPKYTCPRCSLRSCSLPCAQAHKAARGCSGARDRTAFVPMAAYGYAALVADYTFLEDVARRVEGWGRDIVRDGVDRREGAVRGVGMRGGAGRGRGRGGKGRAAQGLERRRYLAVQLALRDVDVDVLPAGMERAQRNRSLWDSRAKKALMTVEFIFTPPPDPYARQTPKLTPLMAHKVDWTTSIRATLRSSLKNSSLKRNEHLMQWLALDDESDDQSSVLSLLRKPRDPSEPINNKQDPFYKLDWNAPLSTALKFKHITEFPTVHLVDETAFEGVLVDDDGTRTDVQNQRALKRRRVDAAASGKKAITTLVGAYGSDDDADSDREGRVDRMAALDTLAGYEGSDDDDGDGAASAASYDDELDAEGETDEEYAEFVTGAALPLPLHQNAPAAAVHDEDEDEDGGWGDDEIAEDEATLAHLAAALQQRFPAP